MPVSSVFAAYATEAFHVIPRPCFSAAVRTFSISEHLAGLDGLAFDYYQLNVPHASVCFGK